MRHGRWEVVKELGKGGQGVVSLAIDSDKVDVEKLLTELRQVVARMSGVTTIDQVRTQSLSLLNILESYFNRNSAQNTGALKVLHPELLKDSKARQRLETEVRLLSKLDHPSLIRVIDSQTDNGWFVTPFYAQGTLASQLHRFAGKPVEALRAFRSLVAGVAELHRQGIVHRDIKPENIFVDWGRLILGDFGIAYVDDAGKTRVSDTYENVGSRDWMPAWAMGTRIEDIRPSFDLFSLGKVLWAMISGKTKMRLWYWDRPEFNLQEQFPKDDRMPWINQLLDGSVREDEEHIGWRDAGGLLNQCDSILTILQRGGQVFARGVNRMCRVCGNGIYELAVREDNHTALHNLGFDPAGEKLRIFQCTNCGHLEIFRVTFNPSAWRRSDEGR